MSQATPRRPGRPLNPIPREKIINTARREFARLGYEATSLSKIAAALDLRKASLLHHFSSKQELYLEVMSGVVAELLFLVEAARLGEGSFLDRLDRLGEKTVNFLAANPECARLLLLDLLGRGPYVSGQGLAQIRLALEAVGQFLAAGMEAGEIEQGDPLQLAQSIISLHLLWFAGADLLSELSGRELFSPAEVKRRQRAVLAQVRALCRAGDG